MMQRRQFLGTAIASASAAAWGHAAAQVAFSFRYLLATCLYGYASLAEIMPHAETVGARAIDLWPKVHGNQREQLRDMGEEAFRELLDKYRLTLGCITQYKLGPFNLADEMPLAQRLGCQTIVTGAEGPRGLQGQALKEAIQAFLRQMEPHLRLAERCEVTIAIENHGRNLIESADAIRWLADLRPSPRLAIALAPYHLPQDEALLVQLIHELGDRMAVFYAWQHGMGCMRKMPKDDELQQLPGRGPLDFGPLVKALQSTRYRGWTEIFMHPFPRGIPILDSNEAVTAELNRARQNLERSLE